MVNKPEEFRNLSIVIPAYCEEENLAPTTEEAIYAASATLNDFEIIIVNDGSTDNTSKIADCLAAVHDCVSVIHFETNQGVGAAYQAALRRARFEYISLVPGDRAFEVTGLLAVFGAVGKADMIISYRINPTARSPLRRLLSRLCTLQLGLTTRCKLQDGHSLYVWPVGLALEIVAPVDYSYHLVTLVTLMQKVSSYAEIPVILNPKPDESSRVLSWKVVSTLAWRLSVLTMKSILRIRSSRPKKIFIVDSIKNSRPPIKTTVSKAE